MYRFFAVSATLGNICAAMGSEDAMIPGFHHFMLATAAYSMKMNLSCTGNCGT